jgi:hypothetical protein
VAGVQQGVDGVEGRIGGGRLRHHADLGRRHAGVSAAYTRYSTVRHFTGGNSGPGVVASRW